MDKNRIFGGQAKEAAEELDIVKIDVGAAHNGDRLPRSVNGRDRVVERFDVINCGEIARRKKVCATRVGKVRWQLACRAVRMRREIVQRNHALHQAGQRSRNAGIGGVGEMHFAIHFIVADVGLERAFHLLHVAAEVDPHAAVSNLFNAETKFL